MSRNQQAKKTSDPTTPSKSNVSIPTIDERLGYLRPSRELLEYYRKKIGEYDVEREDMIKRLDKFKLALEDQVCCGNLASLN